MPGQPEITAAGILGIDALDIRIEQPTGTESAYIIDKHPGPDWNLMLRFRIEGLLAPGFVGAAQPGEVEFFYESIGNPPGGGDEGQLTGQAFDSSAGVPMGGGVYEYEVSTGPLSTNTLKEDTTYKLSATVKFPGWNVVAFVEGPLVMQQ